MREGESWVVVYINDIVICGGSKALVWERTKLVISWLAEAGFKLNINKSHLCTDSVEVVGHLVERNLY